MATEIADVLSIRDTIYEITGIAIRENRLAVLTTKVKLRIKKLGLSNVKDYWRYLFIDRTGEEMEQLVNSLVVSETYFFREYEQLQLFAEKILPEVLKEKKKRGDKSLKLLSAGCSTGEEPYTMAIIFQEMMQDFSHWAINIDAIDINSNSLEKARSGLYTSHSLRETPYTYRDNYFTALDTDSFSLDEETMKLVRFSRVNIFDLDQVSRLGRYDFVFCRNVLIYFDRDSAGKVLENLHGVMNQGAYIFPGTAESIGRTTNVFEMVRFDKNFVYRK